LAENLNDYADLWKSEVERCFGRELSELIQARRRRHCFAIEHDDPKWILTIDLRGGRIALTPPDPDEAIAKALRTGKLDQRILGLGRHVDLADVPSELLWNSIIQAAIVSCFSEFPPVAYYLPAARSGILQSHKTLTSLMWRRASQVGLEDIHVATMTGVLTDFIQLLLNLERRRTTELTEIASYIERSVLRGSVQIKSGSSEYPLITYEPPGERYEIHTTSSMVSELAPVVLFLRHYVNPGDYLIIEEPESHLHPAVQRDVAKVIARLVNAGVTTVITTHSDYFMTQLNNLITSGGVEEDERAEAGLSKEDQLAANLVGAYLFHPAADQSTEVKRLPVDPVNGIPLKEFTAVAEGLYNQTLTLESSVYDGD
jgi:hypothetical protein